MRSLLLPLCVVGLVACSTISSQSSVNQHYSKSGSIVLSRVMPEVNNVNSMTMLGFIPVAAAIEPDVRQLKINRSTNFITLYSAEGSIEISGAQGLATLNPGKYQVLHKQKNPLWYAPDSYFINRNLPVPKANEQRRYRRGALGEFALFLGKDLPIHSGPINSSEIGGIRISPDQITRIYAELDIGSVVEIE